MLILGHTGQPPAPHDLWGAWNLDPLLLVVLVGALWLHQRGRSRSPRAGDRWRARAFVAGIAIIAIALMSPLEAVSGALASAHMVQHVLLMLLAAPLLAFSAPGSTLLRGAPLAVRRAPGGIRRRLGLRRVHSPAHPVAVLLLYIVTLWAWHSAVAYDAALASEPVHILEHVSFLGAALLFWRVIVGARRGRRVPGGLGFLLVFGAAMASVLLSVLMTFATEHWYAGYATTTSAWGLEPLADQQLAGVLMWIPAGLVYVGTALALFASWVGEDSVASAIE